MAGPKPPSRAGNLILAAVAVAALGAAPRVAGPASSGAAAAIPPWFPSGPPSPEFLARLPKDVHVDNFGNAWVTRGSGSPHLLVLAHRDAPGYVVSQITADGYLRLQRLGTPASPLFDQFMVGKHLVVYTQRGMLPAVVTAPSTHFRRGGNVPVPEATVDDLWIDVGAESDDEAREMGIALLDPVVLGAHPAGGSPGEFAQGLHRACGAVADLAARFRPARGRLTCAWVAGGTEAARGSLRLRATLGAIDSVLVVEAVASPNADSLDRRTAFDRRVAPADTASPGSVAWAAALRTRNPELRPAGPLPVVPDARVWSAAGIPTAVFALQAIYAGSPAEIGGETSGDELAKALGLPEPSDSNARLAFERTAPRTPWIALDQQPYGSTGLHREAWRTVAQILEPYGVSEHESRVAGMVRALLPDGAREAATVDARGNLELRLGPGPPARLFVAHMDEIGYRVTGVDRDSRLRVERRGGFYDWLYEGESVELSSPKYGYSAVVAPRVGYQVGPRPAVVRPLNDEPHAAAGPASRFDVGDVRVDLGGSLSTDQVRALVGDDVTVLHEAARLGAHRFAARAIDDRFGDAALVMAARELWPERKHLPNTVWLVWSVEEETGLKGATWLADSLAHHGALPIRVHAVDTFVSSDSPLEDPRIGGARLGQGAVIRAVDTSHEAPPEAVRATLALARREGIPLQFGVTAGGNDGVPFAEHGSINVPLGWPLRSSHSAVEVADLRDLESLARMVRALAEQPARDDPRSP